MELFSQMILVRRKLPVQQTNSGPACRQGHHAPHDRNGVVRQVHEIVHHLRRRELGRHEFGTKCGKETVVGWPKRGKKHVTCWYLPICFQDRKIIHLGLTWFKHLSLTQNVVRRGIVTVPMPEIPTHTAWPNIILCTTHPIWRTIWPVPQAFTLEIRLMASIY